MSARTENLNVSSIGHMPSPAEIKQLIPLSERAAHTVETGRNVLQNILDGRDHRLMVIVDLFDSRSGRRFGLCTSLETACRCGKRHAVHCDARVF